MHIHGTLTKWNDDRGFGFISPDRGGTDVFVHISALPKDGTRPTIGERLTFEIETGNDGRQRATNIICPDRPAVRSTRRPRRPHTREMSNIFSRVVPFIIVFALAFYGYSEYSRRNNPQSAIPVRSSDEKAPSSFHCDGRTYCSEMTSCAEAMFFLQNCPDAKMDGNHDGVPCEQQWCNN